MRSFTCVDCKDGVEYSTDSTRGKLPQRCPEHQRVHAYHLQSAYLDRRRVAKW